MDAVRTPATVFEADSNEAGWVWNLAYLVGRNGEFFKWIGEDGFISSNACFRRLTWCALSIEPHGIATLTNACLTWCLRSAAISSLSATPSFNVT